MFISTKNLSQQKLEALYSTVITFTKAPVTVLKIVPDDSQPMDVVEASETNIDREKRKEKGNEINRSTFGEVTDMTLGLYPGAHGVSN